MDSAVDLCHWNEARAFYQPWPAAARARYKSNGVAHGSKFDRVNCVHRLLTEVLADHER